MTYTDPRSFLYQPGLLDPDGALRITKEALKSCDDGELYLQYSASESFGFDDGRLKLADYSTGGGFGLRAEPLPPARRCEGWFIDLFVFLPVMLATVNDCGLR